MKLYPFKFEALYKPTIWGGESWEIADVGERQSKVGNGEMQGKTLHELMDLCKETLVGQPSYNKFGGTFPLLIKYIDAHDKLSIQVHPNDETARKRHNSLGKTEMWYVVDAEQGAELIMGFKEPTSKEVYLEQLAQGTLDGILQSVPVKKGDVFFIPSGTVHAIGKGIRIAEIQENSDITYRIFDYNRRDKDGNGRELHTRQALDVIDFNACHLTKQPYVKETEGVASVVRCDYFTTNVIDLNGRALLRDYSAYNSFVVYMCLEGECAIACDGLEPMHVAEGETVLLPAAISSTKIEAKGACKLLEVYCQSE